MLSDKLGIPFQKAAVKDYAAVGLFEKEAKKPEGGRGAADGWAYEFETHEVKYIVTQLTEEEFDAMGKNPRALLERIQQDAVTKQLAVRPEGNHPVRQRKSSASPDDTVGAAMVDSELDTAWTQVVKEMGDDSLWGDLAKSNDEEKIKQVKAAAKLALEKKFEERTQKAKAAEKVLPDENPEDGKEKVGETRR